jgi:hypothetical protein
MASVGVAARGQSNKSRGKRLRGSSAPKTENCLKKPAKKTVQQVRLLSSYFCLLLSRSSFVSRFSLFLSLSLRSVSFGCFLGSRCCS